MRYLLFIFLLFATPAWSANFPTNSTVLDSFDRANGAIGASWTNYFGSGATVASNKYAATVETGDYLNGRTDYRNLEAYVTISTLPANGGGFGIYARADGSGTGFFLYWTYSSGGTDTYEISGATSLATGNCELTTGDKLGIRIIGSTIEVWKFTSSAWSLVNTVNSVTYTTGRIGLYTADTTLRLDDISGGEYKTGFLRLF